MEESIRHRVQITTNACLKGPVRFIRVARRGEILREDSAYIHDAADKSAFQTRGEKAERAAQTIDIKTFIPQNAVTSHRGRISRITEISIGGI